MEYCCHVRAGAPSCYLELLDKLQKQICRTVGPSLAASLEPLAHRRNVTSLSLFYRYYLGRRSSELAQLVPVPFSRGRFTHCSDRSHDFFVTIQMLQGCLSTVSFVAHINCRFLIKIFRVCFTCNSCNSMPFSGCSALHGANLGLKKKVVK